MKIVEMKIDKLKVYKDNPRFNDDAVAAVASSIQEFGFKVPIIIDKNNVIVAGHTRYKAAKNLNLEVVPCTVADDLSEEQIKAFRLADNKVSEFAEWDYEKLNSELDNIDGSMSKFGFDLDEIDLDISDDDFIPYTEITKDKSVKEKEVECPYCHRKIIV